MPKSCSALLAFLVAVAALLGQARPARAAPHAQPADAPGWQELNSPLEPGNFFHLAVHPADARTLLLASFAGLYRSTDAGDTWLPLRESAAWDAVYAPSMPQRIYAQGHNFTADTRTLLRSDDGGATWIDLVDEALFCDPVVAPSAPGRLYAPPCEDAPVLYTSADAGATWGETSLPFTDTVQALAVSPSNPLHVVAANGRAVYRSTDGAQTWQPVLQRSYVWNVIYHPTRAGLVYAVGWSGLLRSTDGGATWQEPTARAYVYDAAPWPAGNSFVDIHWDGEENRSTQWNLGAHEWQAQPFDLVENPRRFFTSLHDNSFLYLEDGTGALWRRAAPALLRTNPVFLPVVTGEAAAALQGGDDDGPALARVNQIRTAMGAYPMALDARISLAAANHALYYSLNHDDPAAMADGPHREIPGKPGFTGRTPSNRCAAAGFPSGCGEDMHFLADPVASVDGWIATLYHRLPLISPYVTVGGYGLSTVNGQHTDVFDFSAAVMSSGGWVPAGPFLWVYPFDGQTGVPPSWNGYESPDPLPPGAQHPVGYTITVQAFNGELVVGEAALRDADGALVPLHPTPADCTGNCYSMIAVAPLRPFATYTVDLRGTLAGDPVEKSWQFTTGGASSASEATAAEATGQVVGPPEPLPPLDLPAGGRAEP